MGNDKLTGGPGDDRIDSGGGLNIVSGNAGSETFMSGDRFVRLDGGPDTDNYDFSGDWATASIVASVKPTGLTAKPAEDTLNLGELTQDYVHVFSEGTLLSVPGSLQNGLIADPVGTPIVRLQTPQENLAGLTASSGTVGLQLLGFDPGQFAQGKADIAFDAADKTPANAKVIARSKIPNVSLTSSKVKLDGDVVLRLIFDRGDGAVQDFLVTIPGTTNGMPGKEYANRAAVKAALDIALTTATSTAPGAMGMVNLTTMHGVTAGLETSTLGDKISLTVAANVPMSGNILPASLAVTVLSNQTVAVGKDAGGVSSSLQDFAKIVLPATDNTLVFGNDYGLRHLPGFLASIEPDWITGYANQVGPDGFLDGLTGTLLKNKSLKIDTKAASISGRQLVLDFRAINKELNYSFAKQGDGSLSLKVSRVAHRPVGNVASLVADVVKKAYPNGAPSGFLFGALGKFLDSYLPSDFPFAELVFTNIDQNTVIYGGRGINTFTIPDGTHFPGSLIAGEGRRAASEILSNPKDVQNLLGLEAAPTFNVQNTLKYAPTFSKSSLGHLVNLGGLDTILNVGVAGVNRLEANVDPFAPRAAGLTRDSLKNIQNVTVGPGFNVVVGTNFIPPIGVAPLRIDSSIGQLGSNVFTIAGAPILPGGGGSTPAKLWQKLRDATGLTQALGAHLFYGGTGSDTYRVNATMFGVGAFIDVPDITVGGVTPEAYDTLDLSSLGQDLNISVIDVTTENLDSFRSVLGKVESTNGATGSERKSHILDVGTNVVIVSDGLLGKTIAGLSEIIKTGAGDFLGSTQQKLKSLIPNVDLFGNLIIATDIENIIGGGGNNVVTLVNGAELQGTLSAGGGKIALDYADYRQANDTSGVTVDLSAGPNAKTPFSSSFLGAAFPNVPKEYAFGAAEGVQGNRFFGLDQLLPLFGVTGQFAPENLAVSKGTKVVGTFLDDHLIGNANDNIFVGRGGSDILDGKEGDDTLGFDGVTTTLQADIGHGIALIGDNLVQTSITEGATKTQITTVTKGGTNANEVQSLFVNATGGTFTLEFDGQKTTPIAFNAAAGDVKTALEALSTITSVSVAGKGTNAEPWKITFADPGNQDVATLFVDSTNLVGGKSQETKIWNGGRLSFAFNGDQSTTTLPKNPTAARVKLGIESLATSPATSVTGTGTKTDPFVVTFLNSWFEIDATKLKDATSDLQRSRQPVLNPTGTNTFAEQTLTITAAAGKTASGSFKLKYRGEETTDLAFDANAQAVGDAINAMENAPNVTVTKSGTTWTITFGDHDPRELPRLTVIDKGVSQSGIDLGLQGASTIATKTAGSGTVNEVQSLWNPALAGTFTITFDGQTTALLAARATATEVQQALLDLSNITDKTGVTVSGTGTKSDPWLITFADPGKQDVTQITTTDSLFGVPSHIKTTKDGNLFSPTETQTLWNNASGGMFTISYDGQTTGKLAHNAPASAIAEALRKLSNIRERAIDVNVTGDGTESKPWTINFKRADLLKGEDLQFNLNQITTNSFGEIDITTFTNFEKFASGPGNDVFLNADGQTFVFNDGWGHDTIIVESGGVSLDFSNASKTVNDVTPADSKSKTYHVFSDGTSTVAVYGKIDKPDFPKGSTGLKKFDEIFTSDLSSGSNLSSSGAAESLDDLPTLTGDQLQAIIDEAIARWSATAASGQTELEAFSATVTDLPGAVLGRTTDGQVFFDTNAAGLGWFVDETPHDDLEFDTATLTGELQAKFEGPADARIDLLTVAAHEIGHLLGFEHTVTAGELLNEDLETGIRKNPPTWSGIAGPAVDGQTTAPQSDQTKLKDGLATFSTWASKFSDKVGDLVATVPSLPFVSNPLSSLWNVTGTAITSKIQSLSTSVNTLFANKTQITSADILALPEISETSGSSNREFQATLNLVTPFQQDVNFSFSGSPLEALGINIPVSVTASEAIKLNATVQLEFVFGLEDDGSFFVKDPRVKGAVSLKTDKPFDLSARLGVLGIGIENGRIKFNAEVELGTSGKLTIDTLNGDTTGSLIGAPVLGGDISYDVYLPVVMQGALAGLPGQSALISGAFNIENDPSDVPEGGTLKEFFESLTSNLSAQNFDKLIDFRNMRSLDFILSGIQSVLDELADENGIARKNLPLINTSLADILGQGGTDVIKRMKDAVEGLRATLSDIQTLERDLNFKLSDAIGLPLEVGVDPMVSDQTEVNNAAAALKAVALSLNGASTDGEIAVALAEKLPEFEELLSSRNTLLFNSQLTEYGLTDSATDDDIALALSEQLSDPERLGELRADRDLLAASIDYEQAVTNLAEFGLTGDSTNAEIAAALSNTATIDFANQSIQLINNGTTNTASNPSLDPDAFDLALAQSFLSAHGLTKDSTSSDVTTQLDNTEQIATFEGYRDLVHSQGPVIADALARIEELGLSGQSTDDEIARALVDPELLGELIDARDSLRGTGITVADATTKLAAHSLDEASKLFKSRKRSLTRCSSQPLRRTETCWRSTTPRN